MSLELKFEEASGDFKAELFISDEEFSYLILRALRLNKLNQLTNSPRSYLIELKFQSFGLDKHDRRVFQYQAPLLALTTKSEKLLALT